MRFGFAIKLITSTAAGLALAATALAANRPAGNTGRAEYLGSYTWRSPQGWFGGFSAIDVAADGQSLTVISDRGTIAGVELIRNSGVISTARIVASNTLKTASGRPLLVGEADSEGLAVTATGTICVSFEGPARVACHTTASSPAMVLPRPEGFKQLPLNKALEALAVDRNGHLFTLPEGALSKNGDIPVWRWDGRTWSTPFTLPRDGHFRPVSADFGPDGELYLLERGFGFIGFRSRLRRWAAPTTEPDVSETLLQTFPGTHDNLEGLSIWKDDAGRLRATMVSDDNFRRLQRTELVEYSLPD